MSHIRSKNTKPELILRSALHKLGFRYSLHDKKLPGKPDIVFRKKHIVIFVHGCFWHHHKKCIDGKIPNSKKWHDKLLGNVERDAKHIKGLKKMKWKTVVVWECDIEKKLESTVNKISKILTMN